MNHSPDNLKSIIKDTYWLLAQSSELQVCIDHWNLLLRRIRHELSIIDKERKINNVNLDKAIRRLNNFFEIYTEHEINESIISNKQYELLFEISTHIENFKDAKKLKEIWNNLKLEASEGCNKQLECKYDRISKECRHIPCPRLMMEFENYDFSPESLISRLNRKYKDTDLTFLGAFLNLFCSNNVYENISAIYFTFYYPGRIFDNLNMGWGSLMHKDKIKIAKSWNFIHWAKNIEMSKFLSASIIIKELSNNTEYRYYASNHWVILKNSNTEYIEDVTNSISDLTMVEENHTINNGILFLNINEKPSRLIQVHKYSPLRMSPTTEALDEILSEIRGKKDDVKYSQSLLRKYELFLSRIFENEWKCEAYLRFPVFSDDQLQQGADIFVAFKTKEPKLILDLILEVTEPLAIISSTIDNRMSYKAAALLNKEAKLSIDRLLSHEISNKITVIDSLLDKGYYSNRLEDKNIALSNVKDMFKILKEQISVINKLGEKIPADINFKAFEKTILGYGNVLMQTTIEGSDFVFSSDISGFNDDEKIDERLSVFCLLLIHNAYLHSLQEYMREVKLSINKNHFLSQKFINISVTSSISSRSPDDLEQDLLNAIPIRPTRSFEACAAITKDLNLDSYRKCLNISGEKIELKNALNEAHWKIRIEYNGNYRLVPNK